METIWLDSLNALAFQYVGVTLQSLLPVMVLFLLWGAMEIVHYTEVQQTLKHVEDDRLARLRKLIGTHVED